MTTLTSKDFGKYCRAPARTQKALLRKVRAKRLNGVWKGKMLWRLFMKGELSFTLHKRRQRLSIQRESSDISTSGQAQSGNMEPNRERTRCKLGIS